MRALSVLIATLYLFLAACVQNPPPINPDDPRDCETIPGTHWNEFNFALDIRIPTQCAVPLDMAGEELSVVGEIDFPKSSRNPTASTSLYTVRNASDSILTTGSSGWFEESNRWVTTFGITYDAGTAGNVGSQRDEAEVVTSVQAEDQSGFVEFFDVEGTLRVPYTEIPSMDVAGPSSAMPASIVELELSVENGRFPIAFKWYRDGVLIQSGTYSSYDDSYTTFGLEPGTYQFEVRAEDADGDWNTEQHVVEVTHSG